ncbi:DDE superfamily endonuclease [Popillia japonica]|uniref:DDE superfamily endonuclease n=1 Tax=Popillia japonica TaxID=7064 RepID=A0AAW1K164_POPJA
MLVSEDFAGDITKADYVLHNFVCRRDVYNFGDSLLYPIRGLDARECVNKRRKTWNRDALLGAIVAIKNKEIGYLKASREFGVPKSTLELYCKLNSPIEEAVEKQLGREAVLPPELEEELTNYCLEWFDHFLLYTKPREDDPAVLILDGHFSYTRNLDVIKKARETNVATVCLPPHSTHKLQPLDLTFMAPFKTYYCQQVESWVKNSRGRIVSAYQISMLMGQAFQKAATMEVYYDFAIHEKHETELRNLDILLPSTSRNSDNADVVEEESSNAYLQINKARQGTIHKKIILNQ